MFPFSIGMITLTERKTNMTRILAISSSPNPAASKTRALIDLFTQEFKAASENTDVTLRDLAIDAPVHLDGPTIGAFYTAGEDLSDAQKDALRYSDDVIAELENADIILIGAPMHNFGIPSSLKAWIDHIARAGRTFAYTDNGPKGLLTGKRVIVFGARGGDYSEGSAAHAMDHQTPYLKTVLGFVGLKDITFIHAEGVAMGEEGFLAAKAAARALVSVTTTKEAA